MSTTVVTSGYASLVADTAIALATQANTLAFQANATSTSANSLAVQANAVAFAANTIANQALNASFGVTVSGNQITLGSTGNNASVIGSNVYVGANLTANINASNVFLLGNLVVGTNTQSHVMYGSNISMSSPGNVTVTNLFTTTNIVTTAYVKAASYFGDGSNLTGIVVGGGSGYVSNAFGNAASSTVTLGNTSVPLQLNGSSISFSQPLSGNGANLSGNSSFASLGTTASAVTVGGTGLLTVQGSNVQVSTAGDLKITANSVQTSANVYFGNVSGTFYGDGSHLTGVSTSGATYSANAFGNAASSNVTLGSSTVNVSITGTSITFTGNLYGNGSGLTGNSAFASLGTSATGLVTLGASAQPLTVQGSVIAVNPTVTANLYLGNALTTGNVVIGGTQGNVYLANTVFTGTVSGNGSGLSMNTSANQHGTTATSAVVLGNSGQTLTLTGSSVTINGNAWIPNQTANYFGNALTTTNISIGSNLTSGNIYLGNVSTNVVVNGTLFGNGSGLSMNTSANQLATVATAPVTVGGSNTLTLRSNTGTFVFPVTNLISTTSIVVLFNANGIAPTCKPGDTITVNLTSPTTYNGSQTVTAVNGPFNPYVGTGFPNAVTFNYSGSASGGTVAASGFATMNSYQLNMTSNGDIWLNANAVLVPSNVWVSGNLNANSVNIGTASLSNILGNVGIAGNVYLPAGTSYYGDGSKLSGISGSGFTASANYFGNAATSFVVFGNTGQVSNLVGSTVNLGIAGNNVAIIGNLTGSGANLSMNTSAASIATTASGTVTVGTNGQPINIYGPNGFALAASAGAVNVGGPNMNVVVQNNGGTTVLTTVGGVTLGASAVATTINGSTITLNGNTWTALQSANYLGNALTTTNINIGSNLTTGNIYLGNATTNVVVNGTLFGNGSGLTANTTANQFGTTATSSVVLGNPVGTQTLTLYGSCTTPVFQTSGAGTVAIGVSTFPVTFSGYLVGNGASVSMNTSANNIATTTTGTVTIGGGSQSALSIFSGGSNPIIQGTSSSVTIGSTSGTTSITIYGSSNNPVLQSSGAGTLSLGVSGQPVNVQGNLSGNGSGLSMNTSANQLATSATAAVLVGTTGQNANIVGLGTVVYSTANTVVAGANVNLNGTVYINGTAYSASGGSTFTANAFGNAVTTSNVVLGNASTNVNVLGTLYVNGTAFVNGGGGGGSTYTSNAFGNAVTSNVLLGSATTNTFVGASGGNVYVQGVINPVGFGGSLSDEVTTLTLANQISIRAPYAFTIRQGYPPRWSLNVLPTATTPVTFDLQKNGASIYTSGNQPTIGSTAVSNTSISGTLIGGSNTVAAGDLLVAKVLALGSGTPAGAKVFIFGS